MYEKVKKEMEGFGIPISYYFRSPYMKCVLSYLGFERTIIFLRKYKHEMEDFFHHLESIDLEKYKRVITKCPLKLINFGDLLPILKNISWIIMKSVLNCYTTQTSLHSFTLMALSSIYYRISPRCLLMDTKR